MGLNMAALKQKLNQFKGQGDRSDSLWKPTEGKTVIRIVPWKENPEWPFAELYFHYLGNKTHLSPTSYGNRDPIAEFADELQSEGTKDSWQQAKPFRPKLRTYVPVIVRGEESKGVRFFSFGKTVYQELLAIIDDADYGDIVDVKSGRDIVVEYVPQEKSDTNFAKTTVRPKPNTTPLHTDADMVEKFLKEQPDLRAMYKEPTYAELKIALERYLDPSAGTDPVARSEKDDSQLESPTAQKSATTQSPKNTKSVSDMIDEFDEVFN